MKNRKSKKAFSAVACNSGIKQIIGEEKLECNETGHHYRLDIMKSGSFCVFGCFLLIKKILFLKTLLLQREVLNMFFFFYCSKAEETLLMQKRKEKSPIWKYSKQGNGPDAIIS